MCLMTVVLVMLWATAVTISPRLLKPTLFQIACWQSHIFPFSLMKTLVLNTVLTSGLHYRSNINELMKISTIKAPLHL